MLDGCVVDEIAREGGCSMPELASLGGAAAAATIVFVTMEDANNNRGNAQSRAITYLSIPRKTVRRA